MPSARKNTIQSAHPRFCATEVIPFSLAKVNKIHSASLYTRIPHCSINFFNGKAVGRPRPKMIASHHLSWLSVGTVEFLAHIKLIRHWLTEHALQHTSCSLFSPKAYGNPRYCRPRCPRTQPEECQPRITKKQADLLYWRIRLGQKLASLRHSLRRGPASLCHFALVLCAPVFGPDGKT